MFLKFVAFKTLDPDPNFDLDPDSHWPKFLDPDPHWNQCGSEALAELRTIYFRHVLLLSSVLDFRYDYISDARSRSLFWVRATNTHSLNTELDLQKLFGLLFTAVLIGRDPATPTLGAIGQPRKTSLCYFLLLNHESMSRLSPLVHGLAWGWAEVMSMAPDV